MKNNLFRGAFATVYIYAIASTYYTFYPPKPKFIKDYQ
jgi:hypothetical protein